MRKIAIILIIAILYAAVAHLSAYLAIPGKVVSPVWPPAGIALASVFIFGNIALVGVFIGCFYADYFLLAQGETFLRASLITAVPSFGAALQAYLGKFALIKMTGTTNIFNNTRSVLTFILISAYMACLINATLGSSMLLLIGRIPVIELPYFWLTWWIADAVGVVTVTSTIIAWQQKWREQISWPQIIKLLITWVLILLVGYLTLQRQAQLAYLLIPFAIWAAFQFEIQYSLLTGLVISSICLYGTTHGFAMIQTKSVNTAISLIQIFISIIYLTILLINAILSDRQKAYVSLQLLNAQLEKRVLDRTKDLSTANEQLQFQKNKVVEAFEALKQSHARLMQSEKMASLGLLTAGVAHEIKHPLNAMSANIQSIKKNIDHIDQSIDQIQINEQAKADVHQTNEHTESLILATNEGIKRTAGIIADLCSFARDDEADMVETDLHQNIDSTLNLLSSEMKNNITVIKDYGDIPPLRCHPGKINQVMMNILINAIHALQTRKDNEIVIKTQNQDGSIILSIKDNGPGMKKEVVDKLFTPFFTTKRGGLGSGLGLFLSSNIIKEHNGKISVLSEPDKGTEFIIVLPIKTES